MHSGPTAVDDPDIADDCPLLRRLHPTWIVPDGQGGLKVSRQAFQDPPIAGGAVSVYDEARLRSHGLSGLVVVSAPELSDLPRGYAHAELVGKKTSPTQKALVQASHVRVWPGDP